MKHIAKIITVNHETQLTCEKKSKVHSNFDQTKEKSNALNFKRVRETLAIKK
jgi:hypothetical protein